MENESFDKILSVFAIGLILGVVIGGSGYSIYMEKVECKSPPEFETSTSIIYVNYTSYNEFFINEFNTTINSIENGSYFSMQTQIYAEEKCHIKVNYTHRIIDFGIFYNFTIDAYFICNDHLDEYQYYHLFPEEGESYSFVARSKIVYFCALGRTYTNNLDYNRMNVPNLNINVYW